MKTEPNEPINAMLGFKAENIESMAVAGILYGLTKREYFAAMALASGSTAKDCVLKADAIIEALNK